MENKMICPDCKEQEMVARKESVRYEESGLSNVVLKDLPLRHCGNCGNKLVSIPNISGLHCCIAISLVALGQKIEDYQDHMEELASKKPTHPSIFSLFYNKTGWHKDTKTLFTTENTEKRL